MECFQTPIRRAKRVQEIRIPPSPFMKKIGYGTGVAVYEMQRSPLFNKENSPWAVKKLLHRHKHLNLELNKRLKDEAEVLRRLNHPNIVGFRAFVKDAQGKDVLAMEECSSCLGDLIEERAEKPYPSGIITKVSLDMAKALEYLHNDALLVHCDIKSFNILIKGDFSICKLCDFGVSLPVTSSGDVDLKKAGPEAEYIGTPAWCAPEILKYPQVISTKADVYAFGLVIWEMIALVPPIDENLVDSFNKSVLVDNSSEGSFNLSNLEEPVRRRPALPDVELSEDYDAVLEVFYCCTEEDRHKRPTAKDLTSILSEICKNGLGN